MEMPNLAKKGVLAQAGMRGACNGAEAVRPSWAVCVAQLDPVAHAPTVHSCKLGKDLQQGACWRDSMLGKCLCACRHAARWPA